MADAPLPTAMTPKETISNSFEINQDGKNYKLNIKIINQDIQLILLDENDLMKEYEIKITLNELKQIHKIFSMFASCQEFVDYMKALIENKKLSIKKTVENQVTIELMVEYLFKQNIIKIDLIKKKVNFELIAQDLYRKISVLTENYKNIKEENKIIKEENGNLRNRLNNLENLIKSLQDEISELKGNNKNDIKLFFDSIDSTIFKTKEEINMVFSAIKGRMNKEIKDIKKLYQATTYDGSPENFHKLCDNIPNTLILYETKGNRRFGAFISISLNLGMPRTKDKNCFLFSLDRKKIYILKNGDNYEIPYYKKEGPNICINGKLCVVTEGNVLKNPTLKTNEKVCLTLFEGDKNALSEDGNFQGIYAKDYEVFQVIF